MSLNFFSAFKNLEKKIKLDEGVKESKGVEVVKKVKSKGSDVVKKVGDHKVKFTHSIYGKIIRGPRKGLDVEVRYILPSKIEVEVGSNVEVVSSKELNIGDVVNTNCVILTKLSDIKYMSYCKRVVYFGEDDVKRDRDNVIIKSGPLRNQRGKIVQVYDAKVGVTLMNNTPVTLDESMMFYKDIVLKNGKYFNVLDVKKKVDGSYELSGKEFGESQLKSVGMNDVEKIMNGFKIIDTKETLKEEREDITDEAFVDEISDEKSDEISDEVSEDETERVDYGEEASLEVDEKEGDDMELVPKLSFKDLQQTYFMYSGWSKQQKKYLSILKSMGIMEKNIDISHIMNEIDDVLGYFAKKIKINSRNFDIYNSSIDYRMILACLFAYNSIEMNDFDFSSMEEYVDYLFKREYFMGDAKKSLLVELSDIFPCKELKSSRFVRDRVKMLMMCYNEILQDILKKDIKISMRKVQPKYEPVVPGEKKYDKRQFLLPSDIIDGTIQEEDMNKNIVWNPTYRERIDIWKTYIKSKSAESDGLKKKFYNLIEMNMDRIPLLLMKLRKELIEYMQMKYKDFRVEDCKGNKECVERMLNEYIQNILNGRVSSEEHEMVYRYISVRDFSNEFVDDMRKVRETLKDNRLIEMKSEMDIDAFASDKLEDEDNMLREKIIKWLWRRVGYKLSQDCEDVDCKDKELFYKLKGLLSKHRNKLLDAEIDLIEEFILFASNKISKEESNREIPDVILDIKRKFEDMDINNK